MMSSVKLGECDRTGSSDSSVHDEPEQNLLLSVSPQSRAEEEVNCC